MQARIKTTKSFLPYVLFAVCFVTAAGMQTAMQPAAVANGYIGGKIDSSNQAVGEAAGEFRIVIANLLWAKVVDHYHHQYLEQGGDWSKNVALLPLLSTIIDLDPHFTEAYQLMGGTILPRTNRLAQGEAVLREGIRRNPNDWEMDREMCLLLYRSAHNPDQALPYAQAGLRNADDAFSHRLMLHLCMDLQADVAEETPAQRASHNA